MQEAPNRQHQSQLQRVTGIASEMYGEPHTPTFGLKQGRNPELAMPAHHTRPVTISDFTDNNGCATIKPTLEHFTPALTNLLILEHSCPWSYLYDVAFYSFLRTTSSGLLRIALCQSFALPFRMWWH